MAVFCYNLTWKFRECPVGTSFIGLIPSCRLHPHDLITPRRPHLLTPSPWRLGFQHIKFWGGNKIQSITGEEVYLHRPCDCGGQDLYPTSLKMVESGPVNQIFSLCRFMGTDFCRPGNRHILFDGNPPPWVPFRYCGTDPPSVWGLSDVVWTFAS